MVAAVPKANIIGKTTYSIRVPIPNPANALGPKRPTNAVRKRMTATFKIGFKVAGKETFKISLNTLTSIAIHDFRNPTRHLPDFILSSIAKDMPADITTLESAAPGTPSAGSPKAPKMKSAVSGTCKTDASIIIREG